MRELGLKLKKAFIKIDMFLLETFMTISTILLLYLIYIFPILKLLGFNPRPQGKWVIVFLLSIFIVSISFKMYEKYIPTIED